MGGDSAGAVWGGGIGRRLKPSDRWVSGLGCTGEYWVVAVYFGRGGLEFGRVDCSAVVGVIC